MPVRKPSNRSGSHIIGKFPSLKLGRTVLFESTIERDLIYLLDFESNVKAFEEQPFQMQYSDGNKTRRYTPDFHAILTNNNCLIECKPESRIEDPENQRIFIAAINYCDEIGWEFRVVTDQELRTGHRLRNIKFLRPFALLSIPPQTKGQIFALLGNAKSPETIETMGNKLCSPVGEIQAAVYHMAYHKEVALPLNAADISSITPIYLPGQCKEEYII
jgi:hypothetical protein